MASVQFAYDPLGQLLRETQVHLGESTGVAIAAKTYSFQHSYDPLGNRTATVLPNGQTLNHLFYGSGHLHQVNLDGHVISDFERDALHRETSRTQGQLHSQFAYDPQSRLKAQRVTHRESQLGSQTFSGIDAGQVGSLGDLQSRMGGMIERSYLYDPAGQLKNILDKQRGLTTYGYDGVGRITSSAIGQRETALLNETFQWDAASNPVEPSVSVASGLEARSVKGNRLAVWQDERYAYDVHGNLVERIQGKRGSQGQTVTRFAWDAAHQLASAEVTRGVDSGQTKAVTQTFSYGYDALGRRIAKTDAFGTTRFAWNATSWRRSSAARAKPATCTSLRASCRWRRSTTARCTTSTPTISVRRWRPATTPGRSAGGSLTRPGAMCWCGRR